MADDLQNKGEAEEAAIEAARLSDRGKRMRSDAEERRRERAAAKLRENLARRKQQARARRAGEPEDGVGLPAAHGVAIPATKARDENELTPDTAQPAANSSKPGD